MVRYGQSTSDSIHMNVVSDVEVDGNIQERGLAMDGKLLKL